MINKELINKLNDPSITQAEREQASNLLESNLDKQTSYVEQANNNFKQIIEIEKSEPDSISKSGIDFTDLFNQFNILIENYKEFLSNLDTEQYIHIMNLLGLFVILACLSTIVTIIYSDYLIKYLNKYFDLDNKYPKLSKFIHIRQKLQWYYLNFNFNFLWILFTLIVLFWFNITYLLYLFNIY